jgi:hypothetical protein
MSGLRDITDQALHDIIANKNLTAATLAINGAAAATFKTTSAYQYLIDGVFKSKAALAAQAFSAGHAAQPIGVTQYYAVGLDGSGNVTTYQGVEETFILLGVSSTVPTLPTIPAGICPVGIIKVVNGSANAFVPGTTALDTAGLTVTYFDVSIMPTAPM